MQGLDVDIEANRTEVELATRRTDAAAYFAQRYGPRVKAVVTATSTTELECNAGRSFAIAPDDRGLSISWETYSDAVTERLELAEFSDRVEIGVVERVPTRERDGEGLSRDASVALRAPLGERAVIDAKSGKPMRQVGPGPGDPPCPSPLPRAPAPKPTRLQQAIETRRAEGLRADPAYVRQRLKSGAPYTRAERRWLRQRAVLEFDIVRTDPYTHEHATSTAARRSRARSQAARTSSTAGPATARATSRRSNGSASTPTASAPHRRSTARARSTTSRNASATTGSTRARSSTATAAPACSSTASGPTNVAV